MPLQYNITVEKDENAAYITDINKTNIDSMSNKAIKVNLTDANVDINASIETLKKMEEKQVDGVASPTKTVASTTKTEVSPTKTVVSPTKTVVSPTKTVASPPKPEENQSDTEGNQDNNDDGVASPTKTVVSPTNTEVRPTKTEENQSDTEGNQDNNDDGDVESMRNLFGNEELGGGRNKQSRRLRRIVKHKTGKHKGGKKTRSSNKKYRSTRKIHKR